MNSRAGLVKIEQRKTNPKRYSFHPFHPLPVLTCKPRQELQKTASASTIDEYIWGLWAMALQPPLASCSQFCELIGLVGRTPGVMRQETRRPLEDSTNFGVPKV